MTPGDWREARDIGAQRRGSDFAELAQGFLHIDSVPVDDGVEGQSEGAKLLLLALTQRASPGLVAQQLGNALWRLAGPQETTPIVCVGGSAGGLDAYTHLLGNLPETMGVAIVIVSHFRVVATQLHEILPHYTKMPVELISEKLLIQPDRVFVIPSQRDLHVLDGEFRLQPISKPPGWPDVITVFLRSLAQHWDGKIVAVIVSGYDGDGAEALRDVKEMGGVTIAQKLDTAGQPDMPESAIDTGCIDFILSPEDIALKIIQIASGNG